MWFLVMASATFAVHAIKSRVTGASPWLPPAANAVARVALLAALVTWVGLPQARFVAQAALIPLAAVLVANRLSLSPRKLKHLGWSLVAANALAVALLAAASG